MNDDDLKKLWDSSQPSPTPTLPAAKPITNVTKQPKVSPLEAMLLSGSQGLALDSGIEEPIHGAVEALGTGARQVGSALGIPEGMTDLGIRLAGLPTPTKQYPQDSTLTDVYGQAVADLIRKRDEGERQYPTRTNIAKIGGGLVGQGLLAGATGGASLAPKAQAAMGAGSGLLRSGGDIKEGVVGGVTGGLSTKFPVLAGLSSGAKSVMEGDWPGALAGLGTAAVGGYRGLGNLLSKGQTKNLTAEFKKSMAEALERPKARLAKAEQAPVRKITEKPGPPVPSEDKVYFSVGPEKEAIKKMRESGATPTAINKAEASLAEKLQGPFEELNKVAEGVTDVSQRRPRNEGDFFAKPPEDLKLAELRAQATPEAVLKRGERGFEKQQPMKPPQSLPEVVMENLGAPKLVKIARQILTQGEGSVQKDPAIRAYLAKTWMDTISKNENLRNKYASLFGSSIGPKTSKDVLLMLKAIDKDPELKAAME